jgi:tripartite-type tricarboxylate transporter receptor subunit TctC
MRLDDFDYCGIYPLLSIKNAFTFNYHWKANPLELAISCPAQRNPCVAMVLPSQTFHPSPPGADMPCSQILRFTQFVAASLVLVTCCVQAQTTNTYPNRVVTLTIPFPAGNSTDALARRMQPVLSQDLGQPVVIDNVAGAGGSIGVQKTLTGPADGHALLLATPTELILTPLALNSVKYKPEDLRLVGLVGRVPFVMLARKDMAANNLAELLALMRKSSDKPLSYGSIGPGSLIHLVGARFAQATGVNLLHVPYKGVPPLVQDLMAGQIDIAFIPLAGNIPSLMEQGKLRAYGIAAPAPHSLFPNLATLASQEKSLQGFEFDVWAGMQLPRAVPDEAAARIHKAFYDALRVPELRQWLEGTGTVIAAPMTIAELDRFYTGQITSYQALARAIGVKPE